MGLDMYLYLRKCDWTSDQPYPGKLEKLKPTAFGHIGVETNYCVGYWRKANAIHKWFVDNCADGRDECQDIYVDKEQLQDLYSKCMQVLIARSDARSEELLPTEGGFFFGHTEYDEYYYDHIKETADILQKTIDFLGSEEGVGTYHAVYKASW